MRVLLVISAGRDRGSSCVVVASVLRMFIPAFTIPTLESTNGIQDIARRNVKLRAGLLTKSSASARKLKTIRLLSVVVGIWRGALVSWMVLL